MSFISRWNRPDRCRPMCIDTPKSFLSELHAALGTRPALNFQDPFSMFQHLVDHIVDPFDISVWRLSDHVRVLERVNLP